MRMWEGEISQEAGRAESPGQYRGRNKQRCGSLRFAARQERHNDVSRIDEDDEMQSHEEEIDVAREEGGGTAK